MSAAQSINGLENIYFGSSLCDECMGDCSVCSLIGQEEDNDPDRGE